MTAARTDVPRWAPDGRRVFLALLRLLVRTAATRARLVGVGLLALVSAFTAFAYAAGEPYYPMRSAVEFVSGNLTSFVPVGVLVFGAGAIGDLVDDGSLVYLWLRPVPARLHVLAAWAATCTITVPLVGLPVILSTFVIDTSPELVTGTVLATLLAVVVYSALFVTAGIRFRRALPWGLVYILIWEGFVATAGETAAKLAVRSYVRSILSNLTGVELKLAEFSTVTSVAVPLVAAAAALAYASRRLARADVA